MRPGQEVLFVDDGEVFRQYLADKLRKEGFHVVEAGTAAEAEDIIDAIADSEGTRVLGAVILDGRLPLNDDPDFEAEAIERGDDLAGARAVIARLRARGLGATVLGFSSSMLPPQHIGLTPEDPNPYTDLGKRASRQQLLQALHDIT